MKICNITMTTKSLWTIAPLHSKQELKAKDCSQVWSIRSRLKPVGRASRDSSLTNMLVVNESKVCFLCMCRQQIWRLGITWAMCPWTEKQFMSRLLKKALERHWGYRTPVNWIITITIMRGDLSFLRECERGKTSEKKRGWNHNERWEGLGMHPFEEEKWESEKKGEDLVGITKHEQNEVRQAEGKKQRLRELNDKNSICNYSEILFRWWQANIRG